MVKHHFFYMLRVHFQKDTVLIVFFMNLKSRLAHASQNKKVVFAIKLRTLMNVVNHILVLNYP